MPAQFMLDRLFVKGLNVLQIIFSVVFSSPLLLGYLGFQFLGKAEEKKNNNINFSYIVSWPTKNKIDCFLAYKEYE